MEKVNTPDMLASLISHQALLQGMHFFPDLVVDFVPLYSLPEYVVVHSKTEGKQHSVLLWKKKQQYQNVLGVFCMCTTPDAFLSFPLLVSKHSKQLPVQQ